MPRAIVIGKLRYDIVADTSSFVKGVKGTTKQLRSLERDFKRSLSPLQAYQLEMRRLQGLRRAGAITQAQETRLLELAKMPRMPRHDQRRTLLGRTTHTLNLLETSITLAGVAGVGSVKCLGTSAVPPVLLLAVLALVLLAD